MLKGTAGSLAQVASPTPFSGVGLTVSQENARLVNTAWNLLPSAPCRDWRLLRRANPKNQGGRLAYKSRPFGRLDAETVNLFRNSRLRSLRASLFFRSRWKRALSPLIADMVTQA